MKKRDTEKKKMKMKEANKRIIEFCQTGLPVVVDDQNRMYHRHTPTQHLSESWKNILQGIF